MKNNNNMLFHLLKNIRKKKDEDLYTATEAAYLYEFDKAALDDLTEYYKINKGLIADWYRSLPEDKQSRVKRTRAI